MEVLNTALDPVDFFERLRGASERVLFLDYDGTLAPFHRDPDQAVPYPGVESLLKRMTERCATRVILVSGRRLADMRLPLARIRHDEAWGTHGWERITARGGRVDYQPSGSARRGLQLAEKAARQLAPHGARVERKVASIAVHWRGIRRDSAHLVEQGLTTAWRGIACPELERLDFECGMELRVRGRNKGDVVREVVEACAPGAAFAYLGDDFTDEDAFAALEGRGLSVLVRPEPRPTRAQLWISPPSGLLSFLEQWCEQGEEA